MSGFFTIDWRDGKVVMLDQRRLPTAEMYLEHESVAEVALAIRTMVIRGAPAIGCAAAFGVALAAHRAVAGGSEAVRSKAIDAARELAATRPTAVNLFWALGRMRALLDEAPTETGAAELAERLLGEALRIRDEDVAANRRMGQLGAELLPSRCAVLTHCNAGALATGGYGTALGVIRAAVEQGKAVTVFADETRPLLQGARLTAWELAKDGIDVTVIPDSAAATLMQKGRIDLAVVGADRVAQNGDVANKIGTYSVAVLCASHGLPFYVAAPTSTLDMEASSGEEIPIEERGRDEVTTVGGALLVPPEAAVLNPAFDVTPARLVTAIITERGVARPPYGESLAALVRRAR